MPTPAAVPVDDTVAAPTAVTPDTPDTVPTDVTVVAPPLTGKAAIGLSLIGPKPNIFSSPFRRICG